MNLFRVLDAFSSIIFPMPCRICRRILETASTIPICQECLATLAPLPEPFCRLCGRPFPSPQMAAVDQQLCHACRRAVYGFDHARSFSSYSEAMRAAVTLLKYERVTRLGAWFAARLAELVEREPAEFACDLVVPVPLHPLRKRERGYNQAELIACPLARHLGLRLGVRVLIRVKPRPEKLLLSRREHWEAVRGAYELRNGTKIDNLRILLVDDVLTTGATLDACSRSLKKGGAKRVVGLTVARVTSPWLATPPGR